VVKLVVISILILARHDLGHGANRGKGLLLMHQYLQSINR